MKFGKIYKGKIKIEELDKDTYKCEFTINIPGFGDITLNLEFSNKINEEIDTINKLNSISIEKLTQNDLIKIQENIQKMKIYELLEPLMNSSSNKISKVIDDNNTTTVDENDKEEKTNLTTDSNSVKAYSGDMIVSYSVPSTFEIGNYNSDNYKTYTKSDKDVKVTITVERKTLDEFGKDIEDSKEYFAKSEDYKDVKTSDIQTLEVNGKKFSTKTFEYTYVNTVSSDYDMKYKKMYVYCDIIVIMLKLKVLMA